MQRQVLAVGLVLAGVVGLGSVGLGHGGTYRGPGDTVPPGGGGGGGSGGGAPIGPGPAGGGPGLGGPGAAAPGSPGMPSASRPGSPTTGGSALGPDLTVWSFWWEFNKDPFLNLKTHVHEAGATTGEDTWFLGRGQKRKHKGSLRPTEQQIRQEVVPALKRALATETNNDIVTGALIALAKIGDESTESGESPFGAILRPFLKDANQEIRETAAVSLGILGNEAGVAALTALAGDTPEGRRLVGRSEVSFRTRSFAAYGLSLIGSRTADGATRREIVATLVDLLNADLTRDRDIKVACLIALGLVPLDTVGATQDDGLPPHESRIGQIEFVLDFFARERENPLVRAHAPTAAVRLLGPARGSAFPEALYASTKERIASVLLKRLERSSRPKHAELQSVVIALGMLGDNDADPVDRAIRRSLTRLHKEHSDQQARNFAQVALGQVGARRGHGEAPADGVREVQAALLAQLGGGRSALRPWAALGIGVMCRALAIDGASPPPDLPRGLRDALAAERTPSRVGAYAIGAGLAGDPESIVVLREKLDSIRDDEGRGYCAVALGLLGAREAVEDIQAIVRESRYRPVLLKQAAIALGLLGDEEAVPDLLELLRESRSLASQSSISAALGFIGDRRSVGALVDMLADERLTEGARGFAAAALGVVVDKEPLPWNSRIGVDLNYRAASGTLNDLEGRGILNIL